MLEDTNIGPIAASEHVEYLIEVINDAVAMGASMTIGGTMNTDEKGLGRFLEPTVFANTNNGMRIISE